MTRTEYYKDGKRVAKPRSLVVGIKTYVPPTDEQLIAAGYEIKVVEIPEPTPYVPTYEERVVQLIREKYSIDQELRNIRMRDTDPAAFEEYYAYVEECKTKAKEV